MKPYEEIPHTADWALLVRGATLPELFAHAAEGMYMLMGGRVADGGAAITRTVTLDAPDAESLLVAWLNELLYFTESKGELYAGFQVSALAETHLEAQATGGPAAGLKKQIKAVTFHNLWIAQTADGFETTIVFDV